MSELEAGGISRVASTDGTAYIEVTKESSANGLLATDIELAWVLSEDEYYGPSAQIRGSNNGLTEADIQFMSEYGEYGVWKLPEYVKPELRGFIANLGYSALVERSDAIGGAIDDQGFMTVETTAPNLETWQALVTSLPEDERSHRYVEYDGALYPSFEAMKLLVESGSVQIASKRPDKFHDHYLQPIGWFVQGPKFLREIAARAETPLERAELEAQLPVFGKRADKMSDRDLEYLNPARTYLKMLWGKLDELTNHLGEALVVPRDEKSIFSRMSTIEAVRRRLLDAFESDSNQPPQSLLEPMDIDLSHELAEEVMHRFSLLVDAAEDLKAA